MGAARGPVSRRLPRGGGDVDLHEGEGERGGLVWWLELNVRHAPAHPQYAERAWAVSALAANFHRGEP